MWNRSVSVRDAVPWVVRAPKGGKVPGAQGQGRGQGTGDSGCGSGDEDESSETSGHSLATSQTVCLFTAHVAGPSSHAEGERTGAQVRESPQLQGKDLQRLIDWFNGNYFTEDVIKVMKKWILHLFDRFLREKQEFKVYFCYLIGFFRHKAHFIEFDLCLAQEQKNIASGMRKINVYYQ